MKAGLRIHAMGLFCAYLCLLTGCEKMGGSDESPVTSMIRELSIKPSEDHVELYGAVSQICNQIGMCDSINKATKYQELAERLSEFDFSKLDSGDRVLIFGDYWRSLALLCAKMADEGSLTPESFAILLNGWKSCRDMCNLSTSDSTSNMAVEVQERGNKQKLRYLFENDATLFERDILRLILKNHNMNARQQAEFYDMWHKCFGCRVKGHPEYQNE